VVVFIPELPTYPSPAGAQYPRVHEKFTFGTGPGPPTFTISGRSGWPPPGEFTPLLRRRPKLVPSSLPPPLPGDRPTRSDTWLTRSMSKSS
jgi:hypothetical protein